MATKQNKKTNVKTSVPSEKADTPKVETPQIPAEVLAIRNLGDTLQKIPNLSDPMRIARSKIVKSIRRLADRVIKDLTAGDRAKEKEVKKAERDKKKADRVTAKRDKQLKKIADLRAKLVAAEKDLPPVTTETATK